MTADLAMGVWMYTCESELYKKLNAAMRTTNRALLQAHYFPYIRLLLDALQLIKLKQGNASRTVNRGVKCDLVSSKPDKYAKLKRLVLWEFSSCTSDVKVLEGPTFLGTTGPRTIFQVVSSR